MSTNGDRDKQGEKIQGECVWFAGEKDQPAWGGGPYETQAEAIYRYPREHEVERGDTFVVAKGHRYVPVAFESPDAWDTIDRVVLTADNECGQAAEAWLTDVDAVKISDLENLLNAAFHAWLERYGFIPEFFQSTQYSEHIYRGPEHD